MSQFRGCSPLDEAGLQLVIGVVLRDGVDKVLDLSGKLWHQGGYHILIHIFYTGILHVAH